MKMFSLNFFIHKNKLTKNTIFNKALSKKSFSFQKATTENVTTRNIDQYSAHSPLHFSRGKVDENRSRLFFETPQVPNRIPKFVFILVAFLTVCGAARDRARRRQKQYLLEQENMLLSQISPFVQAMEDLRFTAIEQREYMIHKAVADQHSPALFEHLRWRFRQEDIYVNDFRQEWRNFGQGKPVFNQGLDPNNRRSQSTYGDKGLFDNREVGYVY